MVDWMLQGMGTLMVDWTIDGGLEICDQDAKDLLTLPIQGKDEIFNPIYPLVNAVDNDSPGDHSPRTSRSFGTVHPISNPPSCISLFLSLTQHPLSTAFHRRSHPL